MTTNATTNEDRWARAEKASGERERRDAERRDLRDEWRSYHLHLAESHDRLADSHRRKARDLTLNGDGGGGEGGV